MHWQAQACAQKTKAKRRSCQGLAIANAPLLGLDNIPAAGACRVWARIRTQIDGHVRSHGGSATRMHYHSRTVLSNPLEQCVISLWDVGLYANTERFRVSVPLLPHLCLLSAL